VIPCFLISAKSLIDGVLEQDKMLEVNNMLNKLIEWRKRIFMPDIRSIPNKEWLQALGEETRNSVMIEGIFVDENELKETLSDKYKSGSEVANYFRTAKYYYNLAIELYKTGEKPTCLALIRNAQKMLFDNIIAPKKLGTFRNGAVMIAGAEIVPPAFDILNWMKLWCDYADFAYLRYPVGEAAARSHVFFESIHPFEDGNGRVGRIMLNFTLIAHGYVNIVIKGAEKIDRDRYIKALESAERGIRSIFGESPQALIPEKIDKSFNEKGTSELSKIIEEALIESYDRLICTSNKEKLVDVNTYAKMVGRMDAAVRKAIERKHLIAYKESGRWMIYPEEIKK